MDPEIRLLLALIDEAYNTRSWHGTNLRGSIRGVTHRDALWRPGRGRHNIWEIVVHAAYWKYAIRRRLLGERRGSFALPGSNWFVREGTLTPVQWAEDVALLGKEHRAMREAVARLTARDLSGKATGGTLSLGFLIRGIASHDLYHAGQIQVLKRLRRA